MCMVYNIRITVCELAVLLQSGSFFHSLQTVLAGKVIQLVMSVPMFALYNLNQFTLIFTHTVLC